MNKKAKVFLERVVNSDSLFSANLDQRMRAAELLLRYDTETNTDVKSYLQQILKIDPHLNVDNDECSRSSVIEANGKSFHKGAIIWVAPGSWKYPKRTGEIIKSLDLEYRNSHHLVELHNENVKYFVFPTYLLKMWTPGNTL